MGGHSFAHSDFFKLTLKLVNMDVFQIWSYSVLILGRILLLGGKKTRKKDLSDIEIIPHSYGNLKRTTS